MPSVQVDEKQMKADGWEKFDDTLWVKTEQTWKVGPLEYRAEQWWIAGQEHPLRGFGVYNYNGHYIGDPLQTLRLREMGIYPEKAGPEDRSCRIGFSSRTAEWYAWGSTLMVSFRIGDAIALPTIRADWAPELWGPKEEEKLRKAREQLILSYPNGKYIATMKDARLAAAIISEYLN